MNHEENFFEEVFQKLFINDYNSAAKRDELVNVSIIDKSPLTLNLPIRAKAMPL